MKLFRQAVLTAVSALLLYGATSEVQITADRFEASEKSRQSLFLGHVSMKKGSDELNASKIVVTFDVKRKPLRYEAVGNASFVLHTRNGQIYLGKADRLIYHPAEEMYELFGHVVLKEPSLERTLMGEKVVVDRRSGKASVEGGGDRPVKFIFKVEERNASKNR